MAIRSVRRIPPTILPILLPLAIHRMNACFAPRCVILVAATFACASVSIAAHPVDFNRDIRPLLSNNCLICHGPDEQERAADLRLDTEDGSRVDLGGHAAIVPGDPDASELLARLISEDEDERMPPEGKGRRLHDDEVELIRRWIEQGASYAKHWSYEPPVRTELPKVSNEKWACNPIDHFILARLDQEGLAPSTPADRFTIARRLSMDLIGLPPTWEEACEFAEDTSETAYESYVERLLAKPAFGERWAHVWLDLARYADSAGYADDPSREIWAYRDYVIRSLNENKPFDQFTIEQIAGDLLDNPTEDQRIATAFHRNTMTNSEGGTNDEEFRNVAVADRVNTTMAVWMGTTMACAQCHTHKYDPLTHEEYFKLFAFFNSTEDADRRDEQPRIDIWSEEQESKKADLSLQIASLTESLDRDTPELAHARQAWLAELHNEPTWEILGPSSAKANSRELKIEDRWIIATGDEPEQDEYTIEFPTTSGSLSGLKLEVPSEQQDNFVLSQVAASWKPAGRESIDARFVRIELPGDGKMIHIAELQVFSEGVNVAIQGKATQSSTDFGGKVDYAIDGNTDGKFENKSVTHTAVEKDPWFEVDLGSVKSVDSVVVWNRTDGGANIFERLKGYKILLLDDQRNTLWEQTPDSVPQPDSTFSPGGAIQVAFATASADFEQSGFPATSVVSSKIDPKTGWAVAPQQASAHELTLSFQAPLQLSDGVLTVTLRQMSEHKQHLLNRFRIAMTADDSLSQWAAIPSEIRAIVRNPEQEHSDSDLVQLGKYFRSITALLDKDRKKLASLQTQLEKMKPYASVPVMKELPDDKRRVTKVQIRGNYLSTGAEVSEGTPTVFPPLEKGVKPNRLALAKWLVADDNPLTPRVIANRHWEEIFGTGIVETSEDFGSQGDLPSHPELLDWLAVELRESGWNLKHLLRLMVTSATYRQSSVTTAELLEADPTNRLYARGPRFRVSAESVRDQTLFVSGLLSDKMFGPPVNPLQPELGLKAAFGSDTDWKTSEGDDRYRRGLYTTWRRSSPYPSMAQFDAPNREVCSLRRIRTNTPLQALVTLNDPVYVEAAQALARRIVESRDTVKERIEFAFQNVLLRTPTDDETARLMSFADNTYKEFLARPEDAMQMATQPLGAAPEGSDIIELATWTVLSNVILNLDEILMKR